MESYTEFRQGTQEKYDNLETKNDNTLYFTSDTQRIYKGDTLYADGTIKQNNPDEDNRYYPIYEMTEEEFWNKYNNGDLNDKTGLFIYDSLEAPPVIQTLEDVPINARSSICEDDNLAYIATYVGEGEKGILSVIDNVDNIIKKFNIEDLTKDDLSVNDGMLCFKGFDNIADYNSNSLIGIDDYGWVYMNIEGGPVDYSVTYHAQNVMAINTRDGSYNFLPATTSSAEYCRFHAFNNTMYNEYDISANNYYYKNTIKSLRVRDGGTFGISTSVETPFDNFKNSIMCKGHIESGHIQIGYFKNGEYKVLKSSSNSDAFCTGPSAFSVDYDNNILYGLSTLDTEQKKIYIRSISITGKEKCYDIYISDQYKDFTSADSVNSSVVYYANGYVFAFINNATPLCVVLDPSTGKYVTTGTLPYNNTDTRCLSNFYDNGTSLSFISTINTRRAGDNIDTHGCYYIITWNYKTNKIYKKQIHSIMGRELQIYNGHIISNYVKDNNVNKCTMFELNPDDHKIIREFDLDNIYSGSSNDYNESKLYICSDNDNNWLVLNYSVSNNNFLKIDPSTGNIISKSDHMPHSDLYKQYSSIIKIPDIDDLVFLQNNIDILTFNINTMCCKDTSYTSYSDNGNDFIIKILDNYYIVSTNNYDKNVFKYSTNINDRDHIKKYNDIWSGHIVQSY